MNHYRAVLRRFSAVVLSLFTIASLAPLGHATGNISKGDLQGAWAVSILGNGGCGVQTYNVTFTLNSTGVASNATLNGHSVLCGDTVVSAQSFTITKLSSNGSGTATLTCGSNCAFNYTIQVSADRSTFTVVEITTPSNYWQGVAIHQ